MYSFVHVVLVLVASLLGSNVFSTVAGQHTTNQCDDQLKRRLSVIETKLNINRQTLETGDCPPLFKPYNGSCYYFGNLNVPWNTAKAICEQLGARLASVESYPEDQFIVTTLFEIAARGLNGYFTGGNDLARHGQWIWDSTGRSMTGFTRWRPGQGPTQPKSSDHNCHVYWKPDFFNWHDHPATATDCGFICEKQTA